MLANAVNAAKPAGLNVGARSSSVAAEITLSPAGLKVGVIDIDAETSMSANVSVMAFAVNTGVNAPVMVIGVSSRSYMMLAFRLGAKAPDRSASTSITPDAVKSVVNCAVRSACAACSNAESSSKVNVPVYDTTSPSLNAGDMIMLAAVPTM